MESGLIGESSRTAFVSHLSKLELLSYVYTFCLPGVACIEPPFPPNGTHLVRNYTGGQVTKFGEVAHYICEDEHYFGMDMNLTSTNLTCFTNGSWEFPGYWEPCFHPSSKRMTFSSLCRPIDILCFLRALLLRPTRSSV